MAGHYMGYTRGGPPCRLFAWISTVIAGNKETTENQNIVRVNRLESLPILRSHHDSDSLAIWRPLRPPPH